MKILQLSISLPAIIHAQKEDKGPTRGPRGRGRKLEEIKAMYQSQLNQSKQSHSQIFERTGELEDDKSRALSFAFLEQFSKYKAWREPVRDSNNDLFISFDDNRDMIIQQLDHHLAASQDSPYEKLPNYDQLLEYGCYCNLLDQKITQGQGDPVDEIDEACRAWRRCSYCTRIDDVDCEPLITPYQLFFDYDANMYNCNKNVQNQCARNACTCDGELALRLAELAPVFNEKFSRAGGFDKSQCQWKLRTGPNPPDECCGNYPNRFPYNTNFGDQQCCKDEVYRPNDGQCCVKGRVTFCSF